MKTTMRSDLTTIELLESFWKIHWDSYSPGSRLARRGRLIVMAASLLDDRVSAPGIIAELKRQNVRGNQRPDATTLEAWIARYLLDCFLPAPDHSGNVWKSPDSAELLEAATWIRSHSKPARDITHEDLVRLRAFMGGNAYRTRRSYSAHIEKVIHWGIISGYLDEGFLNGLPSIARKLDAERIDPERVPNERQIWAIANVGGELEGEWFKVAVLLGTFGAMRIGELVALRRRAIRCVVHDGLWLTIDSQIRRYPRRYSDDGKTATDLPLLREDRPDQRDAGAATSPSGSLWRPSSTWTADCPSSSSF
jgi:hypothetical protein